MRESSFETAQNRLGGFDIEPADIAQFRTTTDLGGGSLRKKSQHQRLWKRPRLRAEVFYTDQIDPALFAYLAYDCLFKTFAGLHKAGQGRVHPFRPDRLPSQQTAIIIRDKHDHGRVGPWKMGGPASWI